VLQLGVGGGMKAGIAVWRALRPVRTPHAVWAHLKDTPLTGACACAHKPSCVPVSLLGLLPTPPTLKGSALE
jgi:hypothetical protein